MNLLLKNLKEVIMVEEVIFLEKLTNMMERIALFLHKKYFSKSIKILTGKLS